MGNSLDAGSAQVDVVIVGGGPTGLGAAYRLHQYGFENWLLLDADKHPGGTAGSIKTSEGFRFDHGYTNLVSRYDYFDQMLAHLFNDETGRKLIKSKRNNYVYIREKMISYPVQNNLGGLPCTDKQACVLDLVKAKLDAAESPPGAALNLDDHLVAEWGDTLCNLFFRPYIFKAWAYPTGKLTADWVASKIPPANLGEDLDRLLKNEEKDSGWGFEAETSYPESGGMVGLWRSIAKLMPKSNIRFRHEIEKFDLEEKTLTTKGGLQIRYKQLISTMPLPSILDLTGRSDLTECMVNSSLYVVCLGLRGSSKHAHISGCIYYPEADTIFHRACIFSSHDPNSVPDEEVKLSTIRLAQSDKEDTSGEEKPGPYWSLLLEVSGGPLKTINEKSIADDAIRDACSVGLLDGNDEIVSIHLTEMTHGYPLPTINASEKINQALGWLKSKDIWSRGRFGSFKYEVGDIDQCFIQGVEAVDNMLRGIPERCIFQHPSDEDHGKQQSLPEFSVTPLNDVNEFVISSLTESQTSATTNEGSSLVSDDATVTSDSDMSINAGSVRGAITSEPTSDGESV